MASITIRNLDDNVKQLLRVRAAQHGHSLEEELRGILTREAAKPYRKMNIGMAFHEAFQALGGVDLELPPRDQVREPPDFS